MPKRPQQTDDKYVLRLPDGMRERLKAVAEQGNRSMNAEIIDRLEWTFDNWPRISLSADIKARASSCTIDEKRQYEEQLNSYATDLAEIRFPKLTPEISNALNKLTEFVVMMPTEKQNDLAKAIKKIMLGEDHKNEENNFDDPNWPGF